MKTIRWWMIERLGGVPLSHRQMRKWKAEEFTKAVAHVRATVAKSDKVYMEPVTLVGDNQTIENCTFFGTGGTAVMLSGVREVAV